MALHACSRGRYAKHDDDDDDDSCMRMAPFGLLRSMSQSSIAHDCPRTAYHACRMRMGPFGLLWSMTPSRLSSNTRHATIVPARLIMHAHGPI